jgi:5-methylthioadenosine/S-adenosylhomocysteine deaminase
VNTESSRARRSPGAEPRRDSPPAGAALLVVDSTVLTMAPPGQVLEHQDLLVLGPRIAAIGPTGSLSEQTPPRTRTLDGRGQLLMPGLVNAHNHAGLALFRATSEAVRLEPWLAWLGPLQRRLRPDDVHWSTLLACAEQIRAGITTFADMAFFEEHAAAAIAASGLRAVISRTLMGADPLGGHAVDEPRLLDEAVAFTEQWHGAADGRLTCRLAPHSVYGCRPSLLSATAETAGRLRVGIQTHCAETRQEVADCLTRHGVSPAQLLADTGCLTRPLLLAHAVHLSDEDISLLDRSGVGLSHNPGSNLKLQSGTARIPDLVGRQLAVGLGTDSAASNDAQDLWKELYLAAVVHAWPEGARPAGRVLEMATVEGARALGLEREIGSIQVGKRADLILVDLADPRFAPGNDLERHLVYAGRAADVTTAVVDGEVLMEHRRLTRLDTAAIVAACRARAPRILGP